MGSTGCLGWRERPVEEVLRMAVEAAAAERWVMDGNYGAVRDVVWGRATAVVWLNYPFRVVLWRALCRTTKRVISREELFSGNREGFRQSFLSRDSIILWAITSYRRVRHEYRRILDSGDYPHLRVIELRGPAEAAALVPSLRRTSGPESACSAAEGRRDPASEQGYAVWTLAAAWRPSSSTAISRMRNFWILPVTVMENSSASLT